MNFTVKKVLIFLVLLCSFGFESDAQRFYSVVFNNLPKDMQLYAREDDNTAEVPISGVIEIAGWNHFSVVTYRNKERVGYMKSVLDYAGKTSASFDFKPKIKAEMADYEFEVYACKTTDSLLVVKRSDVVAGDFYVISGQSNASAIHFGNWSSKYARTIARTPDDNPGIGQGDSLWIGSSWSWPYAGAWGVQMQRYILENEGIPTCVINGSLPGSYIIYHSERNAPNPATTSLYGLLYGRIKVAKPKRIRAFFWYQGEQEAIENIPGYDKEYDKLFKYWQTDYPQVEKFVVIQIPVLFMPYYEAGKIRDFQRRTKYIYPKTDTFSASDLPGFDGIHYNLAGYQEFGRRIYNFIRPKLYGSTDSSNVDCPDIKKVFYSSEKKDEITLLFNQDQKLVWPKDTLMDDVNGVKFTKSLRDVFFFDADETKPAGITTGTANGNMLTLKLPAASNAKRLTYLPAYKGEQVRSYYGPFLKNIRGLPAFSFQEVPIADLLVVNPFEVKESDLATVIVSWASAGAESYVLERKTETDTDFKPVKTLDGKTLSYEDKDVSPDATYNYRIQAFSNTSQSVAKTVSIKTVPLLAIEPNARELFWNVYPNPVSDEIRIEFKNAVTGSFNLLNVSGQKLLTGNLEAQKYHRVNVSTLPSGIYILSLTNADGSVMNQKILKK
ncbi:T9SS type A sorting domain-containing protein [Dyadobacter sp. CY323]|uniref:T9SS type A sorting domain-containing protein n=1 Tax=Dyadobacter sp. CY323 TaxID=2907302 RepID=UPI001F4302A2|nr:T9SS type A sorting domain-containing protein [Dyadobacter sp. CY323]MCE6989083.1 T9SS type A sorting domain-containing protein [Dyadobacter sp. CY323]